MYMARSKNNMADIREELNYQTSDEMVSQMAYIIWGAVASTTRAFYKVSMRIDPLTKRIFLSVRLRWWAKWKKLELFRKYWLAKAERKAKRHIPEGWKELIYYERGGNAKLR